MSMVRQIVIHQPTRLEIGAGAANKVSDWAAGASRVLVLAVSKLEAQVGTLGLPGTVRVYTDVPPEPGRPSLGESP